MNFEHFEDCNTIATEVCSILVERGEEKDIPVEMFTAIAIMVAARALVATVVAHGADLRPARLRPLVREYAKLLETICMDTAKTTRPMTEAAGNA